MNTFNAASSAVFDVLLAPWGHDLGIIDLVLWSVTAGLIALGVYKAVSNQQGISRAKERIKMHLLEIRLWRDDLRVVFFAMAKIILRNTVYVAHSLLPMVVLLVPFLIVLFQLEANFAFAPAQVGAVDVLHIRLDPSSDLRATDVELHVPEGVKLDAPPVRTVDGEAFFRIAAKSAGDHRLELSAGDKTLTKTWAVGGELRKIPVKRTRGWEGFLYPGEGGIPGDSPFYSAALHYPPRSFAFFPDGEFGVLVIFFALSLATGFALRGLFGVTF